MPGVVQAPPLDPPRYGLVVSARTPTDPAGVRWEDGFDWAPESCGGVGGIVAVCDTPLRDRDAPRAGVERFIPHLVWESDQCGTMGNGDGSIDSSEREARARRRLLAMEARHIEAELWTGADGDAANQRFEEVAAVTIVEATADPLREALARLELALAACVPRGMIHVPVDVATHWFMEGGIERQGDLLVTALGTIVVAGAGYPGTGPSGEARAETTAWAFGTGIVDLRRGPIVINGEARERVRPLENDVTTYAERVAAATFDPCCLLAINVDIDTRG